jgi:tRNA threonylcarbamoyladenosine biosynthesis protein TsaB
MTPRVLAIDTATEACSAAVRVGDEVYERYALAPRRHSALILSMVEEVLAEAGLGLRQLDGLAFGRGPGSFTGVRIAAGVIQGLALAAGLPVAPISTLAALAQGAFRPDRPGCIVAALDARMGEVYLGIYTTAQGAIVRPLRPETVIDPAAITHALTGDWIGVGSGFQAHGEALRRSLAGHPLAIEPEAYPRARDVALIGQDLLRKGLGVAAEEALPVYLRDRVV